MNPTTSIRCAMVAAAGALTLAATLAASATELLSEDSCSIAYIDPDSNVARFEEAPGLSILHWDPARPLQLLATQPTASAILCWRSTAMFAPNDYVVGLAGLALYIKTDDPDLKRNRTLALEATANGFRIRVLSGEPFSKTEQQQLTALIKSYDLKGAAAIRRRAAESSPAKDSAAGAR